MRTYEFKVCREYPGRQYGTAYVKAKTKDEAREYVKAMDTDVEFDWDSPEFTSSYGDSECGDVEIV